MSWVEIIRSSSGLASMLSGVMEGLGVPWPGAVVMAAVGTGASDGASTVLLSLIFSLLYTGAAWLQYLVGRYFWRFLERFFPRSSRDRLMHVFHKYGELAVLWSRPLALGNYVSLPAGFIRMNQPKFLAYTFVGIMPWTLGITFGGNLIGHYLAGATQLLTAAAVILGVLGALTALSKGLRARQLDRSHQNGERAHGSFAD